MHSPEHLVHLPRDPAMLGAAVGDWLAAPLRRGGGALLACTPAHADFLREELSARGLDVAACEREGRLAIHDAHALLARFVRDGAPQRALFVPLARELLGAVSAASRGPVRVWGEMVDILAQAGRLDAARELEELWNEVLAGTSVGLLCTYELEGLDAQTHARVLADVCSTHTDLVSGEGARHDEAVAVALVEAVGKARADALREEGSLLRARMSQGNATLVALRAADPQLGAEVARRARARLARE